MKKIGLLGLMAGLLLMGRLALSAESSDIEGWEPVSAGSVNTWIAPLCGKGESYIQPFWFINNTRGSYDSNGSFNSLPDDDKATSKQLYLFVQYGLTDKINLAAQTVYQKSFVRQSGVEADSVGLGDSNIYLLYCLQEEKENRPHLTLLTTVKIPTGKFENANIDSLGTDISGTGSYDPGLGLILTKKLQPMVLHADLICTVPLKTTMDQVSTKYGAYWNYDAGLEIFISHGFNILLEGNGFAQGKTAIEGTTIDDTNSSYIVFGPGIGWSNDQVQTLLALQTTTSGKNADAINSWVFTLIYNF
jgi:hypothetical protein